jgi:hypothetical protein
VLKYIVKIIERIIKIVPPVFGLNQARTKIATNIKEGIRCINNPKKLSESNAKILINKI